MDQPSAGTDPAERPHSTQQLPPIERRLLDELLVQSMSRGAGVPADKFRAENYEDIQAISALEAANHIRRDDELYVVLPTVLPLLDSDAARNLLKDIESVYTVLRKHYRAHQKTPISVSTLATGTGLSSSTVGAALRMMSQASLAIAGSTGEWSKGESTVTPSEDVLKYGSFTTMVDQVRQWHSSPRANNGFTTRIATVDSPDAQRTSQRKKPLEFSTAFETYTVSKQLGEGGAGRVYLAASVGGQSFAVKVLSQSSTDKRRRFKNEVAFLRGMRPHSNVVTWIGDGFSSDSRAPGPFYVMPAYEGSLRDLLRKGVAPETALEIFGQVLAGVEAAHRLRAVHRDLKPENVLYKRDAAGLVLAVADFGIAQFHPDDQSTLVETRDGARLANFDYHAPEQRLSGGSIDARTDIFALGLMLNELFTGEVPRGAGSKKIAQVAPDFGYLDELVEAMMQNSPDSRPATVADVRLRTRLLAELQANKSSSADLSGAMGKVDASGEELIANPLRVVDADWQSGTLTLTLSQPVTDMWIECLRSRMSSWESVLGAGPENFRFSGTKASVGVQGNDAQRVIDTFKTWIPKATLAFKDYLESSQRQANNEALERLKRERAILESAQRVNAGLRI